MSTTTKLVTVWLDETSDADEPRWIVDTDTEDGGESSTIKTYPGTAAGRAKAVEFGRAAAARRGCALRVTG
jgi:hypothetical protein